MKKAKMIKGIEYIRVAPAKYKNGVEDYSYTCNSVVFDGVDEDGCYIMHYPAASFEGRHLGTAPFKMSAEFSDNNWKCVTTIKNGVKTALHKNKGMMIKRVKPIALRNGRRDYSYYRQPVQLLYATRYHLVVFDARCNKEIILDCRNANPDEWTVA